MNETDINEAKAMIETHISSEFSELAKALSKAQSVMKPAKKNCKNTYFGSEYADLEAVWDAVRKPLTDNGFAVTHPLCGGEGEIRVGTKLLHSSGQFVYAFIPIKPSKIDPQAFGSVITYFKRYGLEAVTGCCTTGADDDGEGAMDRDNKHQKDPKDNGNGSFQAQADVQEVFGKHEEKPKQNSGEASVKQIGMIRRKGKELGLDGVEMDGLIFNLTGESIESFYTAKDVHLTKSDAHKVIDTMLAMIDEAGKKEEDIPF